jgi:hypothetical protein
MGYTKRQFVEAAFGEIGMANYVFDLQPEQLQSALRRLDTMMAYWNGKGIRVGYPIPSSPQSSDLDEESQVPDVANEAIITNLAIKIAPGYGRIVSSDTKASARSGYTTLLGRAVMPAEQQISGMMPSGAGNRTWGGIDFPFLEAHEDKIQTGQDGYLEY